MSTKCTVAFNRGQLGDPENVDFHLYQEITENDCIYLEIEQPAGISLDLDSDRATMRIPKFVWERIATGKFENAIKDFTDEDPESYTW